MRRFAVLLVALGLGPGLSGCGDEGPAPVAGRPVAPAAAVTASAATPQPAAPGPRAAPSADPAPTDAEPADAAVAGLSTAQLVGQRLIASFRGTATPPEALLRRIRRGEVAGVVLFAENADTLAEARALARRLQAIPRPGAQRDLPLLVMVDQEGGLVQRIRDAPPRRGALASSRVLSPAQVQAEGRRTGAALRGAGINVDLAPVSDVPRRGSAMLREERTWGRTAKEVRSLAPRFAAGLVAGGVAATAKHFPGFGPATVNTDDAPATIRTSRGQLRDVDQRAARAVVTAGARLVMLANAIYPALDARRPATLSRAVATTELRRTGFDGVSVTDDLEANALRSFGAPGALAVASASAGADLLLFGRTAGATESAASALATAAKDGRLRRSELRASASRVLALRRELARR